MKPTLEIGRHDAFVTVALIGDLDIADVEQVRLRVLAALDESDAHGLIVDLAAVRYLDSAGVNMLFALIRRLESRRQRMAIAVPEGSPVGSLLKITNLRDAVPVFGTFDECLDALAEDSHLY